MRQLKIKSTAAADRRGDLRAALKGSKMLLPARVVTALTPLGIRTAVDLLVYLNTFPTQVAQELGWEVEDVQHALELLREQLKGVVDDAFLYPPREPEPPWTGALDPSTLKQH